MTPKTETIEDRKNKCLKDVEDSYNNPKSKFYRDNERFRWALKVINDRYNKPLNPLK